MQGFSVSHRPQLPRRTIRGAMMSDVVHPCKVVTRAVTFKL